MDVGRSFIPDAQAPELMQPGDGPLDDPAGGPEAAPMRRAALGEQRLDPALAQLPPMRLGVIRPVALDDGWAGPGPAPTPPDRWNAVDQGEELGDVVGVRASQGRRERDALRVAEDVVLTPRFAAVRGVGPRFFPPNTARTEELSTMARDQSMRSAPWSWASNAAWIRDQTPACCQARSRRQQLMPAPQPSSWGRASHGIPVRSTKRMPVRVWRWLNGLRPG